MNRARVVAALRELADAIESDELDVAERQRPKRERRPRALTRPAGEATPIVAAQAARLLRDKGFT